MTDTPLWLNTFPDDFEVAHERTLRGLSKVPERVYYPGVRQALHRVSLRHGRTTSEPAPW